MSAASIWIGVAFESCSIHARSYLQICRHFAIKKLQDECGYDLDLSDTVEQVMEGEANQEKMTIQVVQRSIEREMSIPPESNLTPVNSRKRPHQINHAQAHKRRRVERNSVMLTVEERPQDNAVRRMEGVQQHQIDGQDHSSAPDVLYIGETNGTSESASLHHPAKIESPEAQRVPEIPAAATSDQRTGDHTGILVMDSAEHASPGSKTHLDEDVADDTQTDNHATTRSAQALAQRLEHDWGEELPAGTVAQSPGASRSPALLRGLEEAASEDASEEPAPTNREQVTAARGTENANMPDADPEMAGKADQHHKILAKRSRRIARDVFDVNMSDDTGEEVQHAKKLPLKKPAGRLRSAGNGAGYALKRSSMLDLDNSIDGSDGSNVSPLVAMAARQKVTTLQASRLKEVAIPVKARSPERNVQKLKAISATSNASERGQERRTTPSERTTTTPNVGNSLSEEASTTERNLNASSHAEQVPSTAHAQQPVTGRRQSPPIEHAKIQPQRRLQSAEVLASPAPSANTGSVRRTRIPLPSENKKEQPTKVDMPKLTKAVSNATTEKPRSVSRDALPGKAEPVRSYRRVPLPSELTAKANLQSSAAKAGSTPEGAIVTNAASKASATQGPAVQKQRPESMSNSKSPDNAMAVSSVKTTSKSKQEGAREKKGISSEEQNAADTQSASVNRNKVLQDSPKPTQGQTERASVSAASQTADTQQVASDNTKRSTAPVPSGKLISIESDEESSDDDSDSSEEDDEDDDESDSGPDSIPHHPKDHDIPDADGTKSPSAEVHPRVDNDAPPAIGDATKTGSDALNTNTQQSAHQDAATEQFPNDIRDNDMESLERHGSAAKTTHADEVKYPALPGDHEALQSEVGSESASGSESEGGTESEQASGEKSDGESDWNGLREVIKERTTKTAPAPAASPKHSRFSIQPNGELRDEEAARAQLHESQESYNSQMQAKPHEAEEQGDDDAENEDDTSESDSGSESEGEVMHHQADAVSNAQVQDLEHDENTDEEMQDQMDVEDTPQPSKLPDGVHPEHDDESESESESDSETGGESNNDSNDEEDDEDEEVAEEDEARPESTVKSDLPSSPPSLSSPTPTSHARTHHSPPSTPTSRPITPGANRHPALPQHATVQARTKHTADNAITTSVRPPISGHYAAPKRKFPSLSEMKQLSSSQAQAQSQASLIPESSLGASSHRNGATNGANGSRPTLVSAGYDDTESERSSSDSEDEPEKDSQEKTKNPYAALTGILYKGMGLGR